MAQNDPNDGPSGALLLTVEATAQRLSLSRSTVYELIGRGELRAVHVGRAVRLPAREVSDYAERLAKSA